MTWGATLAAALIIGAIVGRSTSSSPPAVAPGAGTIRLVVPVPPGVTDVREPAASPDGRFVVFAGVSGSRSRQLYIQRLDESAPHHVIQVLDATTGQNAISQIGTFKDMIGVTGLIITKLDGTAKGGIVIALAKQFKLPIHAIGVGEAIEDLDAFDADSFAKNLLDL